MNLLRLSLNLLRRDWRAGEWRVLLAAMKRVSITFHLSAANFELDAIPIFA